MKVSFLILGVVIANLSQANCYHFGSGSFRQTYCDNGNSYSTTHFGNSTITEGSNSRTGSRWDSTTQNVGDTSFTTGRDSDGNYWNTTTRRNDDDETYKPRRHRYGR